MNTYKITLLTDIEGERTQNWSGYVEQGAIAQAFLYWAQNGARKLEVLEIKQI